MKKGRAGNNITNPRPTYEVSVGAVFFCVIKSRNSTNIVYDDKVTRQDVVKSLGITPTLIEQEIWASGVMFDYISQTIGADVALNAVALDDDLLIDLSGATLKDGFIFNRVDDLEKEFALGYFGENRDGTQVFYWHPLCKIIAGEETKNTRTNDPPDPQKNYKIKVMPFGSGEAGGVWRIRYDQKQAIAAGLVPLTIDEFFSQVIYSEEHIPEQTPQEPPKDGGETEKP